MMYQKYLVTGAMAPVGRLVVQMLLSEGCQVRVLVPPETDYSLLRGMGAEISEGEIFDKDSLKEFFTVEDPRKSAIIHTEEILSISNNKNMDMRRINVAGCQNVVDMAMRSKIGRFVYLGSAYSLDPDSALSGGKVEFDRTKVDGDYAATKAEASAYIMEKITFNKFNASLLLPTFIIGPGFPEDYDMNRILKKYLENKVSTISGGHAFVDVRNVATALVAVCENGETGGTYILNGEYKSSQEFFAEVAQASGAEQVKEMPKWTQSKSMDKLVSTFCRITKKDNPKEVYALFMNNPDANYESTVDGILPDSEVRKVHDSLVDVLTRPGNDVRPDRVPDLEKAAAQAEAAKAEAIARGEVPKEEPKEVSKVSEAVMKRAEESAARAALSGEDAEKRAAAAAAARERVQAKIEAAKLKAEAAAEAAKAEMAAKAEAEAKAAEEAKVQPKAEPAAPAAKATAEAPAPEAAPVVPAEPARPASPFSKISVADMMAEAQAKKEAEKAAAAAAPAAVAEPEPVAEEPAVEDVVDDIINEVIETPAPAPVAQTAEAVAEEAMDKAEEDFGEFVDASAVAKVAETVEEKVEEAVEAAPEAAAEAADKVEEKIEKKAEEKDPEADSGNKPLWERISADDITEEEIFGEDTF